MSKHQHSLGAKDEKGDGAGLFDALDAIPTGYEAALLALEPSQCRWPIGNPDESDFHFCTAKRVKKSSTYCPAHEWDAARVKRGRRPVVVSLGGTALRRAREQSEKSKAVTTGLCRDGQSEGSEVVK